MYCVGASNFKQTTTLEDINTPFHIPCDDVYQIFAKNNLSCCLTNKGKIIAWGLLNSEKEEIISCPKIIAHSVIHMEIFHNQVIMKKIDGSIQMLKSELPSVCDISAPIINVFAQFDTLCYLTKDYQVLIVHEEKINKIIMSDNEYPISMQFPIFGQFLLSNLHNLYYIQETSIHLIVKNVISIAATQTKLYFLSNDARIYEMDSKDPNKKIQITGIIGTPILLFAGASHSGCVTYEGTCWTWGNGSHGQLGNSSFCSSLFPTMIKMKDDVKIICAAAGDFHTMILAVRSSDFVPNLPGLMLKNQYSRVTQMKTILPGAAIPCEFDVKF